MRSIAIFLLSAAGLLAQGQGPFRPNGNVPAQLPPTVPSKGPAWVYPAVAFIDSAGYLDGLLGNSTDCVHIDGTSGPCISVSTVPVFSWGEVPTGTLNGVNANFNLAATPSPAGSLALYRNGILQKAGGVDYGLSGSTITFTVSIPQAGDVLQANYQAGFSGGAGPALRSAPQLFSALPACTGAIEGTLMAVSDSTTAIWGAIITGLGTNHVLAYCNGMNWTVAAK